MNAIFICVIVLVKMCFHMLNLCLFKHKKIFEYFRCFWKVFCFYKKLKIFKNSVALFWLLSRGSSKSHASTASSCVNFGDLFVSEGSSCKGYTEIFPAWLTLVGRPSSHEKHLENFSQFCLWVFLWLFTFSQLNLSQTLRVTLYNLHYCTCSPPNLQEKGMRS